MAQCKNYKTGETCPELYEVHGAGEVVESSGKRLDQYCYYCLATPRFKKVGHKASWSGSTPKWCPKGKEGIGGVTMKPIRFKQANKNLLKPQSMTDEECSSLWCESGR